MSPDCPLHPYFILAWLPQLSWPPPVFLLGLSTPQLPLGSYYWPAACYCQCFLTRLNPTNLRAGWGRSCNSLRCWLCVTFFFFLVAPAPVCSYCHQLTRRLWPQPIVCFWGSRGHHPPAYVPPLCTHCALATCCPHQPYPSYPTTHYNCWLLLFGLGRCVSGG